MHHTGRQSSGFYEALTTALVEAVPIGRPFKVPWSALHVWDWFVDLDQTRGSNGPGALRVPFQEIRAWAQLRRAQLRDWELSALLRMDAVRTDWLNTPEEQRVSDQVLTPELFLTLFSKE